MKIRGNTIGTTISADRVLAKAGGIKSYYSTNREEVEESHENLNADYIFGLYDALLVEHPGKVQKNEIHNNDGTFTNYEYVISTGDYSTEGTFAKLYADDSNIKKPKHLVLSGIHGDERNTALSTYRFVRDVLSGHNVPQAFREGVIISVMPVGTPSAFNAFTRKNDNDVDVNRNFESASPEKETQAIMNWLTANSDAELFIDFHNSGALNEKVVVLSLAESSTADSTKKIALRGVDRIIPFWRDVIGYPDKVEANGLNDDGTGYEVKERDVIYSYSASPDIVGCSMGYADKIGVRSFSIETAVYYGNHSEWADNKATYSTEAIAMGAEALGNVLLEFYEQFLSGEVIDDMKEINTKLDELMASVNSGFRMESGVYTVDADAPYVSGVPVKIPCSSGAKILVFKPDGDANTGTYKAIMDDKTDLWTIGVLGNCLAAVSLLTWGTRGVVCRYAKQTNGSYSANEMGVTCNNTDGFSFTVAALKAGTYNWTAYYWNE